MENFIVKILPAGWEFDATAGASVLFAAEAAGIVLPSSCRNGTCRTCICQLDSRAVSYVVEWPGLSIDEKREGWILPCVALACSDLVLKAPAARRLPGAETA